MAAPRLLSIVGGLPGRLARVPPQAFIWGLLVLEALTMVLLLPSGTSRDAAYYSIGFVDDYDRLAWNLAQGHGYRFAPDTALTLTREPGFPLLLAGLFSLFGYSLTAARLMNLVLAGLAALVLCRLVRRVTDQRWAQLGAAAMFLLHPGVLVAELRGGVEIPFILLSLLFLQALCRALDSRRVRDYALAGLLLGVASSVRSTALLFPVLLLPLFLLVERPRPSVGQMVSRLAVLGLCTALVLLPWTVRNYRLVGEVIPTASVQGIAAHAGQHICRNLGLDNGLKELDAEASYIRGDLAREQGYRFHQDYYLYFVDSRDEVRFNNWLWEEVMREYRERPMFWAGCIARNAFNFWFAGKNWTSTMLNVAVQLPCMILGLAGVWLCLRAGQWRLIALPLAYVVYTAGIYLPLHAQARYSIPLVPVLALLAAAGFAQLASRIPGTPNALR